MILIRKKSVVKSLKRSGRRIARIAPAFDPLLKHSNLILLIYSLIIFAIFIFFNWLLLIATFIVIGPILSQIPSKILIAKLNFFTALGNSFKFEKGSYGDGLGNIAVFSLITIIFFQLQ